MSPQLKPRFELLKDRLAVAVEGPAIKQALCEFASDLGFDWFAYLSVDGSDSRGLSNYPSEWREIYWADNLASIDPILESLTVKSTVFQWSARSVPIPLKREHRRFFDLARAYGIRSGVAVPVFHGFGRRALFTLASREEHSSSSILVDPLTALTAGAFIDGMVQCRDYGGLMEAAPTPLTARQLECLCWLKSGKTTEEIAVIRGVTRRSVEFQLHSIRAKLNVLTTYQALYIAAKRQWI